MNSNSSQIGYIINDIIKKTFASNERLLVLLYNVQIRLLKKIKKQDPQPLYRSSLNFFQYQVIFAEYQNQSFPLLKGNDFKLSFFDRRSLKSNYKKAMADHEWELNKMKLQEYQLIKKRSWKYVTVFIDTHAYLMNSSE